MKKTARKLEDKMDAKNLQTFPISVRCQPPATSKKVPINYWAYIVMADGDVENNVFHSSLLMQDRRPLVGASNLNQDHRTT